MKKWSDYLLPSGTLKNLINIENENVLDFLEFEISGKIVASISRTPIIKNFSLLTYKQIHKEIFKNIYDWAGKFREVNIAKGGHSFCDVCYLDSFGESIFESLNKNNLYQNLEKDEFIKKCASLLSDINAWHPFREGNGRTQKVLLNYIANINGYHFMFNRVLTKDWVRASIESFDGADTGFKIILSNICEPIDKNSQSKIRKAFGLK